MLTDPGTYAQPQLVQIPAPVPETSTVFAGALLLVPLGLSALRQAHAMGKRQI
jgi:hypothetical protein